MLPEVLSCTELSCTYHHAKPHYCPSVDLRCIVEGVKQYQMPHVSCLSLSLHLQEVDRRLAAAAAANTTAAIISSPWSGHLVNSSLQLTSHSRHRPMDLRVIRQQQQEHEHEHESGSGGEDGASIPPWLAACEVRLKIGAVVAAEMRAAVKAEAGFRCVSFEQDKESSAARRTGCTVVCYVCGRAIARAAEVVTGSGVLLCGVPALAGRAK